MCIWQLVLSVLDVRSQFPQRLNKRRSARPGVWCLSWVQAGGRAPQPRCSFLKLGEEPCLSTPRKNPISLIKPAQRVSFCALLIWNNEALPPRPGRRFPPVSRCQKAPHQETRSGDGPILFWHSAATAQLAWPCSPAAVGIASYANLTGQKSAPKTPRPLLPIIPSDGV